MLSDVEGTGCSMSSKTTTGISSLISFGLLDCSISSTFPRFAASSGCSGTVFAVLRVSAVNVTTVNILFSDMKNIKNNYDKALRRMLFPIKINIEFSRKLNAKNMYLNIFDSLAHNQSIWPCNGILLSNDPLPVMNIKSCFGRKKISARKLKLDLYLLLYWIQS
jgi:hypothetical protein